MVLIKICTETLGILPHELGHNRLSTMICTRDSNFKNSAPEFNKVTWSLPNKPKAQLERNQQLCNLIFFSYVATHNLLMGRCVR